MAQALEALMGLAARAGHLRVRTGPKDPRCGKARVCYDHLAGDLGVKLFDRLQARKLISGSGEDLGVTGPGRRFFTDFGIAVDASAAAAARFAAPASTGASGAIILGGSLGSALLSRFFDLKWARRDPASRAVHFSSRGLAQFEAFLGNSGSSGAIGVSRIAPFFRNGRIGAIRLRLLRPTIATPPDTRS